MVEIDQLKEINKLKASLEALLFVAPQAVTPAQLAAALEIPVVRRFGRLCLCFHNVLPARVGA